LISKKSSPLKPLGQMNRNLVGSILGRSSIKIAHLLRFGSFGKRLQRRRFLKKSTNQKQELSVAAMFVSRSEVNEQSL
jgi:hypothetical protein